MRVPYDVLGLVFEKSDIIVQIRSRQADIFAHVLQITDFFNIPKMIQRRLNNNLLTHNVFPS